YLEASEALVRFVQAWHGDRDVQDQAIADFHHSLAEAKLIARAIRRANERHRVIEELNLLALRGTFTNPGKLGRGSTVLLTVDASRELVDLSYLSKAQQKRVLDAHAQLQTIRTWQYHPFSGKLVAIRGDEQAGEAVVKIAAGFRESVKRLRAL